MGGSGERVVLCTVPLSRVPSGAESVGASRFSFLGRCGGRLCLFSGLCKVETSGNADADSFYVEYIVLFVCSCLTANAGKESLE